MSSGAVVMDITDGFPPRMRWGILVGAERREPTEQWYVDAVDRGAFNCSWTESPFSGLGELVTDDPEELRPVDTHWPHWRLSIVDRDTGEIVAFFEPQPPLVPGMVLNTGRVSARLD